jgi:hypothetical protein
MAHCNGIPQWRPRHTAFLIGAKSCHGHEESWKTLEDNPMCSCQARSTGPSVLARYYQLHSFQEWIHPLTEMRILFIVIKQVQNSLFCMPNRIRWILFISAMSWRALGGVNRGLGVNWPPIKDQAPYSACQMRSTVWLAFE